MIEQQPNNIPQQAFNDDQAGAINLHDIIRMILMNWYWFVLSVLVCLGVAYYYLAKTPKIYSRTAHHPRQGLTEGRRTRALGLQRPGQLPDPTQRRQRNLYPPVLAG